MTRRASYPLGMMPPGAQLAGVTGFALPRLGAGCAVVLSSRSTPGKRSR
ncbi:MAG: hypothetical protein U9N00_05330 [Candidatus Bipolaricaulota bacterium]|nr:hypothetical protein [Candidatus Bipolaricaulota bacterium]